MTLNYIRDGPHSAHCACQMCCVSHVASSPPPPMHMYGQRAAQNGRLWVTFFVTKYRDLFCDQGRGWGGGVRAGPTHPVISIPGVLPPLMTAPAQVTPLQSMPCPPPPYTTPVLERRQDTANRNLPMAERRCTHSGKDRASLATCDHWCLSVGSDDLIGDHMVTCAGMCYAVVCPPFALRSAPANVQSTDGDDECMALRSREAISRAVSCKVCARGRSDRRPRRPRQCIHRRRFVEAAAAAARAARARALRLGQGSGQRCRMIAV